MSFDPKCYETAEHFMLTSGPIAWIDGERQNDLGSVGWIDERLKNELAQVIQTAVEDWLEHERDARITALLGIEQRAKALYERDGMNAGCLPTDQAWAADREAVRNRYRRRAEEASP